MHPTRVPPIDPLRTAPRDRPDPVTEAMRESFPASDPPAWTAATAGRTGVGARQTLPTFRLPASTGQTLETSSFLGKVPLVMVFVPDLGSEGAREALDAFSSHLKDFGDRRAQVLGVARETAATVRSAADRLGTGYPILADASGSFTRASLPSHPDGVPSRSIVLVVDAAGTILRHLEDQSPADAVGIALDAIDETAESAEPS